MLTLLKKIICEIKIEKLGWNANLSQIGDIVLKSGFEGRYVIANSVQVPCCITCKIYVKLRILIAKIARLQQGNQAEAKLQKIHPHLRSNKLHSCRYLSRS